MIFRLALAVIYLYAGGAKLFSLALFKATILAYFPIPEGLALLIAIVFPWLEILAGLSLLLNWKTVYSSVFLFLLSLFFFAQKIFNYNNILPYGCGCFGFGTADKIGIYHILRDFSIATLAGLVFWLEYKGWRGSKHIF